jgi:hypothetical protein
MSDGDWYQRLTYRLVAITLFLLAVLTVAVSWNYGLNQERLYEQEAIQAHADYTKYSCQQINQAEEILSTTEQPLREPCTPNENAQQENDNRRNYADLVAQRSSALWAKIMGIAALIGMGLSAVGVALVWITFKETQKTNEITATVSRPILRAYVQMMSDPQTENEPLNLTWRVIVDTNNIGPTTARFVKVTNPKACVDGGGWFALNPTVPDDVSVDIINGPPHRFEFTGDTAPLANRPTRHDDIKILVKLSFTMSYADVFGRRHTEPYVLMGNTYWSETQPVFVVELAIQHQKNG